MIRWANSWGHYILTNHHETEVHSVNTNIIVNPQLTPSHPPWLGAGERAGEGGTQETCLFGETRPVTYGRIPKVTVPLPSNLAGKSGRYFRVAVPLGWLKHDCTVTVVSEKRTRNTWNKGDSQQFFFFGPYLAFSISVLPNFPKKWKSVKHEFCMNQICHRKVDAHFWNYDVWHWEYARINKILLCLISKKSRKHFKPCALFNILMKLPQKTPKFALKLCFEAMKFSLACVFVVSGRRLFLNITSIVNSEQFSILRAFLKILTTTTTLLALVLFKTLTTYAW